MKAIADEAVAMFLGGHNCAQSVLACCGKGRGISRETAIRVAQAFGGGIGKTGNLCGALTGGLMVIGTHCAAIDAADTAAKARAHKLAQAMMNEFARCNGSLLCRDLIGCDMRTSEGMQHFQKTDAMHKVCAKAVRTAVEIIETLLSEDNA